MKEAKLSTVPMPDNPLAALSLCDLGRELTYAEQNQDHVTESEISDILIDKLIDEETSRIRTAQHNRPANIDLTTWNNQQSDALWEEVVNKPIAGVQFGEKNLLPRDYQRLGAILVAVNEKKMQKPLPISVASCDIFRLGRRHENCPPQNTVLRNDFLRLYGIFTDRIKGTDMPTKNAAGAERASHAAARAIEGERRIWPHNPLQCEEDVLERLKIAMLCARESIEGTNDGRITTATFFTIENIKGQPYLAGAHAGNSRIYFQQEFDGPIVQLTTDQAHTNHLRTDTASEEPSGVHGENEFFLKRLRVGSRIVVCSAGIAGNARQPLSTEAMQEVFSMPTPARAANKIATLSKEEDKSVVVVDINEPLLKPKYKAAHNVPPPPDSYEKKRKRRRRILTVLGAVAVMAAGAAFFINNLQESEHDKPATPNSPPVSQRQPNVKSPQVIPRQQHRLAPKASRESLAQNGATIWSQSATYLQKNHYLTRSATINNIIIDSVKDDILRRQGLSETAAKRLPVGYTFMIPRYALKKARNLKNTLIHQN
jgi:hypothetical protein